MENTGGKENKHDQNRDRQAAGGRGKRVGRGGMMLGLSVRSAEFRIFLSFWQDGPRKKKLSLLATSSCVRKGFVKSVGWLVFSSGGVRLLFANIGFAVPEVVTEREKRKARIPF